MQAPKFWQNKNSKRAKILNPLGRIYTFFVQRRLRKNHPYQAQMPVICVGNLSVGGVGKTPVCLALGQFLRNKGQKFYYLNHGYKARQQSVLVDVHMHTAVDVGDEALLLALQAPTIVDSMRARGAQLAEKLKAQLLIMDDGFQNPSLVKTLSFVVVDGFLGFGNERVLPAGPLREPVLSGLKRADAVILVGDDTWGVRDYLKSYGLDIPVLTGRFMQDEAVLNELKQKSVGAFAGIGHPNKFFEMLTKNGIDLKATRCFPDHYFYTRFDIDELKKEYPNLIWATTTKDWVKIPEQVRTNIVAITGRFKFDNEEMLEDLLKEALL